MTDQEENRSELLYGWAMVVVTALFTGVGNGSLIMVSVFLKPMIMDFGWLRGDTALAYTAGTFAAGVGGIVMGLLSDRFSPRPVVLAGAAGLGLSFLLLGRISSLWQFYLLFAMLGGLGTAAFYAPLNANVVNWFSRNKGLAVGVATAGQAALMGLVPYLASFLISTRGWRAAFAIMGASALLLLLPLALLVRTPPGHAAAVEAAKAAAKRDSAGPAPAAGEGPPRLRILVPWLSVAAIFCCICMSTPMVHVVALALDKGVPPQEAAGVLLRLFIAGFFGRIFFGRVTDHIGGPRAYWLASAGQTALVFWFTRLDTASSLGLMAIPFGFFYAGVMTCLIVAVRELTPIHRRGLSLGIVTMFAWSGMGLGGYQGGYFFDLTGDYNLSFINAVLAGIINLLIAGALLWRLEAGKKKTLRWGTV